MASDVVISKTPRVDVELIDEPSQFVLLVTCPGAGPGDIRVDVSPQRVVVNALPSREARPYYVAFERAIALPARVLPEESKARLNRDVLEVRLPKAPQIAYTTNDAPMSGEA